MHRPSRAVAASTILLALAGCSGPALIAPTATPVPTTATSAPSPDAAAVSTYLTVMRAMAEIPAAGGADAHLSPQQTSDTKLISVGREACRELQNHQPAAVVAEVQQEGWTRTEAFDIVVNAASLNSLCPERYKTIDAWMHTLSGS